MGTIKTTPIVTVNELSKEDFVANYLNKKPVLIKKSWTNDWPAQEKWNLEYIQSLAGETVVPLYNNEPTKGKQNSAMPVTEMRLFDYLEILKTKPTDLRIFFYDTLKKLPILVEDIRYPDIGLKFFKRLPVMFFGGDGSNVLPHYDMDVANLVHYHFHGHKRVWLFPPNQSKNMYQVPFSIHSLESIDMDNPDFEKYPALQELEAIEVFMEHGDALYMPPSYWHYIKYLDGGFSITLRAFQRNLKGLSTLLYNVGVMRNVENVLRKTFGTKWTDYKEKKMVEKVNRKYNKRHKNE